MRAYDSRKARKFTFHYVSINSFFENLEIDTVGDLHSTMYLLIQKAVIILQKFNFHLHSTMYLLIRVTLIQYRQVLHIYIPLCIY